MDEQFDKNLNNRIRDVFEVYEHPADADAGWAELRKRFPAQSARGNARLWWGIAAAVLLVAFGIGLWMNNPDTPVKNYADNTAVKPLLKDTPAANGAAKNTLPGDTGKAGNMAAGNAALRPGEQRITDPLQNNRYNNGLAAQYPAAVITKTYKPGAVTPLTGQQQNPAAEPLMAAMATTGTAPKTTADSAKLAGSITTEPQIARAGIPVIADQTGQVNSMARQQPKTIIERLEADKLNDPVKKEVKAGRDKKVNFSIYAATYFNYAEGSTNQVNAGAGFTSDIRLGRKVKLSTGLALAQNTLRYNTSLPQSDNGRALAFASTADIKQDGLFVASASVPVFRNYNANLIGLDVPINIKYEFNPEKSDTYISAGLSSGTFIDERYTYSYTYSNNITSALEDATTTNSFNSFYFGKTLNVSFGLGYPLGKSNRLIIEPFLKYPLDGLGAQQLRFGAGGLNLKINFRSAKK